MVTVRAMNTDGALQVRSQPKIPDAKSRELYHTHASILEAWLATLSRPSSVSGLQRLWGDVLLARCDARQPVSVVVGSIRVACG